MPSFFHPTISELLPKCDKFLEFRPKFCFFGQFQLCDMMKSSESSGRDFVRNFKFLLSKHQRESYTVVRYPKRIFLTFNCS